MSVAMASPKAANAWAVLMIAALGLLTAGLIYLQNHAPTTIVVLTGAEVLANGRPNPGLSAAGLARAQELVRVMGEAPVVSRVAAVFATRYRRSQETAEPIARHFDLPVHIVDATDHKGLLERIDSDYRGQLLIVVTDRDALPGLIDALLPRSVPVAEPVYDRLYIVTRPRLGGGGALAMRYGTPAGQAGS